MRAALLAAAWLLPAAAVAQPGPTFGNPQRFTEADGASLYAGICAGCHMPDGRGAAGAGAYPALRANPRLASAGYVIARILRGGGDMPGFGASLSDDQVAQLAEWVRTHLENDDPGPVSAGDVAAAR